GVALWSMLPLLPEPTMLLVTGTSPLGSVSLPGTASVGCPVSVPVLFVSSWFWRGFTLNVLIVPLCCARTAPHISPNTAAVMRKAFFIASLPTIVKSRFVRWRRAQPWYTAPHLILPAGIKTPSDELPIVTTSEQSLRRTAREIFEKVEDNAHDELRRSTHALAFSGLAGGFSMGLTGLGVAAATAVLGDVPGHAFIANMLYPIGFIAVIIGRAQLFTENTLYPVALVLSE